MSETSILDIRAAAKSFGGTRAIDGVDLSVRPGEFITLLGPSGCGKTSLSRAIAGFVTLDAGTIAIRGRNVTDLPTHKRALGMVFQNLALFPHMTVAENVGYGFTVRRIPDRQARPKIQRALSLVDLAEFGNRKIHQLSGGQQQRVALARALATEPDLLLLDEPLSALDLKLRRQLQEELKRIQRAVGATFIFVTHDQEEALSMSDRIAVLNKGRVEQFAPAAQVYAEPSTIFVANFIGDSNLLPVTVEGLDATAVSVQSAKFGRMTGRAAQGVRAGGPAMVLIRPECIRVDEPMIGPAVRFDAELTEKVILGSTIKLKLRAKDMVLNAVVSAGAGDTARLEVGRNMPVSWSTSGVWVMPAETARGIGP